MGVSRRAAIWSCMLFAACKSPPRTDPDPGSGSGSGSAVASRRFATVERSLLTTPPIELPKQDSFVVLDAGKGAKTTLRYAFADGTIETHVETKLASRQLDKGTFGAPVELPAIRDGFGIRIA